jgi:25S rRNA (adenine2142-N1)-methyltransferase
MRTKRTRKAPLTSLTEKKSSQPSSHKSTQSTISTFHTLLKREAQIKRKLLGSPQNDRDELRKELDEVRAGIKDLGGLETYQDASKYGQSLERGGDSAKVLIAWLRDLGYDKREERLR